MTSNQEPAGLPAEVLRLLAENPGQTAKQLAAQLGVEKKAVNSILYGHLRSEVVQDKSYRWYPADAHGVEPRDAKPEKLDTPLARLCRYYLDCLNYDDQGGLSVFASSKFDLDYVELETMPLFLEDADEVFSVDAARRLLNKSRRDRTQALVLGYPAKLSKIRSRRGWEGCLVEPILLFPFEDDPSNRSATPVLTDGLPQINFKAVKSLTTGDSPSIVEEVVQLVDELGLANAEAGVPDLDEVIPRLHAIRPEWPWSEEPDPERLIQNPPLAELSQPGIYNRAVLLSAERSPYTRGLETELTLLQSVNEEEYAESALGDWVRSVDLDSSSVQQEPLLEVLPLNSEQRTAVLQGLTNQLTVITGPPGTGKSQIVTSLLVNAAWRGKTVLFASKNNKAVDVVEVRVNGLGPRPVLLRLGRGEFQARLAEYLVSLLAASASDVDERRYVELLGSRKRLENRFEEMEAELAETIELRNRVDAAEQRVETVRREVGDDLFRSCKTVKVSIVQEASNALISAVRGADRSQQPFFFRLFWPTLRSGRFKGLWETTARYRPVLRRIGIELPPGAAARRPQPRPRRGRPGAPHGGRGAEQGDRRRKDLPLRR